MKSPLRFVQNQIKAARSELDRYHPACVDWYARSQQTAIRLVPWLIEQTPGLCEFVASVMNSPSHVRESIDQLFTSIKKSPDFLKNRSLRRLEESLLVSLEYENLLIADAGGTVVSKLIERYLIKHSKKWELESNGASDYPDLFFRGDDYSELPAFKRGKNQVYGAAVKGNSNRPVRIPDGLEIKTCKNTFAVDCHHAHVGLHLVMVYEKSKRIFSVKGVFIGFMREEIYRITVPSSPTTTLKASFNGDNFISLFGNDSLSR